MLPLAFSRPSGWMGISHTTVTPSDFSRSSCAVTPLKSPFSEKARGKTS
jgi:hypothetical protein